MKVDKYTMNVSLKQNVGVSYGIPLTGLRGLEGPRHMKVVTSSAVRTGLVLIFLETGSTPGTWTCQMLRKKIPSDTTGD